LAVPFGSPFASTPTSFATAAKSVASVARDIVQFFVWAEHRIACR